MKKTALSTFDPYRRWLGIPQVEQPPHHYRLLGIGLFEEDPDVIQNAADRQMAHVRTFQTGPHSADSQRILNELSAATICLLDPQRKTDYDHRLRRRLENKGELRPGKPNGAASDVARPLPIESPVSPPALHSPEGQAAIEPPPFLGLKGRKRLNIAEALRDEPPERNSPMAILGQRISNLGAPVVAPAANEPAAMMGALSKGELSSGVRRPAKPRGRKTSAVLAIVLGLIALAMCAALGVLLLN